MDYKYIIFFLFCALINLSACVSSDKSAGGEAVLSLHLEADSLQTVDWATRMQLKEVVCLSDNEDSLLSIARKCLLNDTRIVFWDHQLKCVYVYDRKGNFLFTIGRQGGAGYECADLRDIYLSRGAQARIELLDATGILVFDAEDGHFLEKKKLGQEHLAEYYQFAPLAVDDYLLFTPDGEYSIYRCFGGQMKGLRKREGYQLITDRFSFNGDTCVVNADYGMFTIDTYSEGTLKAAYHLDFEGEELPVSLLPQTGKAFIKIDAKKEYFKSIASALESDQLLYAKVVGPSQTYYDVYYNKRTKRLLAGPSDMSLGINVVAVEGEFLYALVFPEYISDDNVLYGQVKKYFVRGIDSNPVLIKFKLNEN